MQHVIDRHLETHPFDPTGRSAEGLTAYRPIILEKTHYETLSNNVGLRATAYDYGVLIQDDMIMVDHGWDRHLLRPALGYDDVLAVTGRCAHNDYVEDKEITWPDQAGPGCGDHNYDCKLGDTFSVRDIANRGPLLLDMQKAHRLDFFSEEYYPFEMDDHDVSEGQLNSCHRPRRVIRSATLTLTAMSPRLSAVRLGLRGVPCQRSCGHQSPKDQRHGPRSPDPQRCQ